MAISRPRIVFMGTPQFAVSALNACLEVGDVVLVVCQPDKPVGRGGKVEKPPVKVRAEELGIDVVQPVKVKGSDLDETIRNLQADVAVVAAYGRILPQAVLDAPKGGCVNVHASLLPKYRGAAPVQWAIANGEKEAGVSLMKMEAGLDTGPYFAQASVVISEDETGESLLFKLAQLGGQMIQRDLIAYLNGERPLTAQDESKTCYAPIIQKADAQMDFTQAAAVLEARLRGFTPWPGAFTHLGGKRFKVHQAKVDESLHGTPGTVLWADERGIAVATGKGGLILTQVQLEGSKRMAAADFLKGKPLAKGTQLGEVS